MNKNTFNDNKNIVELSEAKKEKLGILKVLNVLISEDEEVRYNCIMDNGTIKVFPASELK